MICAKNRLRVWHNRSVPRNSEVLARRLAGSPARRLPGAVATPGGVCKVRVGPRRCTGCAGGDTAVWSHTRGCIGARRDGMRVRRGLMRRVSKARSGIIETPELRAVKEIQNRTNKIQGPGASRPEILNFEVMGAGCSALFEMALVIVSFICSVCVQMGSSGEC